ncbi:MAG: putative selenate reductase subunit YgfK [Bacteroidetes bacterium]|nr:putative selenate reductase subunit YgfK [Bacteroidota bacterium]MBU1115570.1 putative selenate reductase subunit YgfK [Bacteroidota bacterium]MBU1799648.1 putative selenate reductase subunit YgfK [Bacteroidota bacterium]
MSDKFYRISIERLFQWILNEEKEGKIFGIYKENIFTPPTNNPFEIERYGQILETPLGVAAGPHTQMAQNIVAAWLTGSRYIELKTVQTLDELEVTKPCIEMEDEGYNCEWSQELKIKDSFDEYLNAWIIIHILKHKFGWENKEIGVIFNMSVGYNLEGILKPNVQWFFDKMNDCSAELEEKISKLEKLYPPIGEITIPKQISNNITLSTMHGCPANEIESIGKYLIENRKLHTTIKLNPTLLGKERLRYILNEKLGFDINVPDEAFEHDLKYDDAILIIKSLQKSADNSGVQFSLKLTNTLEAINTTNWLPEKEKMVYASGRALHPISINVAKILQESFDGKLDLSFSAGIDAFNVADTLACNLKPITVCTDLLKPGGYLRMTQYFTELQKEFDKVGAKNIDEFIISKGKKSTVNNSGMANLFEYADRVLENKAFHKNSFPYQNIKTSRKLTAYDCVHAPCSETCAITQDVSEYMWHTANGNFERALHAIMKDNPLPNITGNVCDHLCQTKCTRMNYDNSLLIRGIKRFNSEKENVDISSIVKDKNGLNVAIIGAGPSGLSSAFFLALEGFNVNVYEAKPFAGGMAADSIPFFRLTDAQIKADVDLIKSLGVNFNFNHKVDSKTFMLIQSQNDFIHIAVGAQNSKLLNIPGENYEGVFDQLNFLSKVRRKENVNLGKNVAIIGGGNSAIDAARTANRLVGSDGKVTVVYRRTKREMPADAEEIKALLEEGIELLELTAPLKIEKENGKLKFNLIKMELGEEDKSGRRKPLEIPYSEFSLFFDSIIPAIGQEVKLDFLENSTLNLNYETLETDIPNVFAGGDAIRGADSLINAIADGKNIAREIIKRATVISGNQVQQLEKLTSAEFQQKQAVRVYGKPMPEIALIHRNNFELVHPSLNETEAIAEASRCLFCNDVCNICVGVCPNFANVAFEATPENIPIYRIEKRDERFVSFVENYFTIEQKPQIFNIGDFCNECGNCNTFCPTNDAPYLTKPKFYLTETSFDNEDNCYYLSDNVLVYKNNGIKQTLKIENDKLKYLSESLEIEFNMSDYSVTETKVLNNNFTSFVTDKVAEMIFLIKNLNKKIVFN